MTPDLDALERAARAVTKGDLATAEITKDGSRPCPCCDTEGYVDGRDYINVDGVPLNIQFSGIGPEFGRWEAYFQATQPAAILALIARARAAEAALGEARRVLEKAEAATQDAYQWGAHVAQNDLAVAKPYGSLVRAFLSRARAWLAQNTRKESV